MATPEESKLEFFLEWLKVNKVELRGCKIEYCDSTKGVGIFSSDDGSVKDGILLVVPLDLAITPMRVLQDPLLGPECSAMYEEGDVDDRFLMILFLMLERLRKKSSWKPYLDVLPTTFGNPLWFNDNELLELKGTTLYRATELQKQKLQSIYNDKVEMLVTRLLDLDGDSESKVSFEDFLWANSIFWTRALNIPLPRSYVFPENHEPQYSTLSSNGSSGNHTYNAELTRKNGGKSVELKGVESQAATITSSSVQDETVWVEGLVPAIDFCNHDIKASATWEVDGTGLTTGVPLSMYLLSVDQGSQPAKKEIFISYGDKGNEELLYLYGFVIDNNPDDYLMVHYPSEAIQNVPFFESKLQLLEAQKGEMSCLLPRSLLGQGLFEASDKQKESNINGTASHVCNYSWSGQRKLPSYIGKLVFPEKFMVSLRTIAMQEEDIYRVSSLLEELVGSREERQPSDTEVQAAIWEVCGDSGALQLLVDLLNMKMMDLEEASGTEDADTKLLQNGNNSEECINLDSNGTKISADEKTFSRNTWSSIKYRRGQKQLTRLFLKEAEQALQLALSEGN
ncbi:[Fructose-bisphosphate aldolase]-lysine N-methyltransferase [Heracleum sosnowskyi]|uniref:[Fructose-bisphosphate aldolase]-lysine N-methyltransferase n=1 Tax=Heracleum sosnowskyi TaxID=360622 RepID=A0AAD8ML98_9APIA|nr:[Fructose-bisphosphate aldolase]-lysine N-methyltransferase [Heracleum sosnowskyi]